MNLKNKKLSIKHLFSFKKSLFDGEKYYQITQIIKTQMKS